MPRRLRTQVLALSVRPILGLAAVAICVSVVLTRIQVDAQAGKSLQRVSRLLSVTTRAKGEALDVQTKLLADLPTLRSAVDSRDENTITERARYYLKRTQADVLMVTDADGNLLGKAGRIDANHFDSDLRSLVAKAQGGESAIEIVSQGGKLYSAASTPIFSQNHPIGALTALSLLSDDLALDLKKATAADVLFLSAGKVVGGSLPVTKLSRVEQNSAWRIDVGHTSYVALATSLPGSDPKLDACLIALRSYDELAGPYRSFSTIFTVLILLALVMAGALARAFAATLAKPLESLVRTAQIVRDGEWPEPLSTVTFQTAIA